MRLENNELISEYYKSIKDKYPELSPERVRDICISPWLFLKHIMESGTLEEVRLKYFGVFYVCSSRAVRLLEDAKLRFSKQYMSPKQFFKIKTNIETFLKNENKKSSQLPSGYD